MAYAEESFTRMAEAPNSGDERLLIRFHITPMKDSEASLKEGRPIFVDTEYIEIIIPGDRDGANRPVSDEDRRRFAVPYAKWKASGEQSTVGTPLSQAAFLTRSQVEELRFFNITTVEALAGLNDATGQRFMGIQGLKQKAQALLDLAKGEAPVLKAQAELQKRDEEIALLKGQLAEQAGKIDQLLKRR